MGRRSEASWEGETGAGGQGEVGRVEEGLSVSGQRFQALHLSVGEEMGLGM